MNKEVVLRINGSSILKTIDIQLEGMVELREAIEHGPLGAALDRAVDVFGHTKGRIILTGMGKSGHVARKIAATMRSTGTAALYLHAAEASHGDLGIIGSDDVVFALTWSGETRELSDIFDFCRLYNVPLIVATAYPESKAGKAADICLALPLAREACPNELAPTTSTTLQVVLGDALAMAMIEARGFSHGDFRVFHPGGRLGTILSTVGEVMGTGNAVPSVPRQASLVDATIEMNRKRYGCTAVVDDEGKLVGAFTDGDLRRCIASHDLQDGIAKHMSHTPVTACADMLCSEALELMNKHAVSVLFVTDAERLIGIIHIHDIVRLGV